MKKTAATNTETPVIPVQVKQSTPTETKEQAFHRIMNRHLKSLSERYRMMRRTANSYRPCQNDAELICIAVNDLSAKFTSVIKARVQEETDTMFDIFK
jgi:hypothetical protein